ncbi:Stk1 family PASTA domain-containing Ser/Thr kinase [Nocardioides sp.]|uniref:Stk1 family PASTA domain-containing Ser/Thr kinase n=1 Tax=Nocardioides sp. TaxID=35761 RepID=UPI002D80394F|nr:Stk1 family PASTA domain-containing Ser/Thr kinase [Nocardioides sp.]HET8962147.1 Stk1 family PASTA domain-containing Ser/Thr kinase [Nocardioides sp.]
MSVDGHARTGVDAVASDPMIGRLLDRRYRIRSRIARGGMASVYEATDIRLDRTVAVKVMHPGLGDDDEFAARFVREARAAARLSHPNVVSVYDQGDEDGTVYLAMECVAGHTLRDVIRKESPMSPGRAIALVEPVLSALAAAHRAGLIHRDIKPENVLISTDPDSGSSRVKVADFGLAKAVSADTQHTATGGVLIGTVSYLAPELVVDGRADARADVYAVGVVLYELLTGAKPHEGESPIQVAYKHVHEDVPAPSSVADDIPGYVDALVARATARDRGQRPADAAVLLHQLHRVGNALAAGVREDPELEADLAPRPAISPDTAPEPFDADDFAELLSPAEAVDEQVHTTALERPSPEPARGPEPPSVVPTGRPRRSKRGPVLFALALLLVASVGVAAWWFGYARYTPTPGVIGLERAAAVDKIEASGLSADFGDRAYSETVPAGQVMSTEPSAGENVLDGGTVVVVLSLGKERYDVPKLRGLTEDRAQDRLLDTNLAFGQSVGRYSETVPEGTVLRSDPPVGTTLRPDAVVDLVVSKGPRPIRIRDFTGQDADRAIAWFERRDLEVDTSSEHSDSVAEGDVISQSPVDGTAFAGDPVELVVSDGPELVEVPSGLVASGVDAARERLEAAGFEVEVENDNGYIGLGYVFRVDPSSGTMVPAGSTITLYLI